MREVLDVVGAQDVRAGRDACCERVAVVLVGKDGCLDLASRRRGRRDFGREGAVEEPDEQIALFWREGDPALLPADGTSEL